jgi:hypothetical protein
MLVFGRRGRTNGTRRRRSRQLTIVVSDRAVNRHARFAISWRLKAHLRAIARQAVAHQVNYRARHLSRRAHTRLCDFHDYQYRFARHLARMGHSDMIIDYR